MSFTTNFFITLFAYLIDNKFGEFSFIKHPVILIGDLISFSEKKLYKDSVFSGLILVLVVLSVSSFISFTIEHYLNHFNIYIHIIISSFLASMFIAHKMLRDSVHKIIILQTLREKRQAIAMLVSRDTQNLSENEINKAAIETYAENLSDGVIAPMFYLLFFGLPGIIIYKTINTMDSMIGYRNERYEKFGKIAARLDDIANFIPARITALGITLLCKKGVDFSYLKYAKLHESPNAGFPITAMALCLNVKLGGDTSYFGKVKKKPFFGNGKSEITQEDIKKMLHISD
ncbi:adenosylcobinamide-phosphate synthase CbiB [Sulfurimonas sp. C5]|uniref:adenosylcobinamide-phosphate synthase CbiB n=1 Tax=Sulfurimonas sp. C5 TaxID=3036947 RepID=UPI00245871F7|nr:adenosylcobinamide-phosphate synthase CbiB [Sulfurimonas sp. C5]MDH4944805.1 adenosylcobinamide-phosphate synthase CbiB [Sulfurimonas sp. C5]